MEYVLIAWIFYGILAAIITYYAEKQRWIAQFGTDEGYNDTVNNALPVIILIVGFGIVSFIIVAIVYGKIFKGNSK